MMKENSEFEENTEENTEPSLNDILELQNQFQEIQTANKISYSSRPVDRMALTGPSRYYYTRPTPQDILYEEDFLHTQKSYHGKTIYEWNIDGKSEYQIFETVHHILMYCTVCKQNDNSDHQIARFIVNGFTGILKGWWDNFLSEVQKSEILNATKGIDQQQDACYTLIQAILLHFVGPGAANTDRSKELLQNLRCSSLTHFRWYKDGFLMKVLQRSDANSEH